MEDIYIHNEKKEREDGDPVGSERLVQVRMV